ncbi:MAG: DUF99 family protein [Candidatus Micrarchaeota archaeon]|nr:DUF99 family protein [Candidatus Micrarchaeota archaeon]
MKSGSRFIAITSGPIQKKRSGSALIVGVIGKDGTVEGILSSKIKTDGTDSTSKIIRMIAESRFREQIRIVALNGIALAGLNVVDIPRLEKMLGVQAVIITRSRPRPKKLLLALRTFAKLSGQNVDRRIALVRGRAKVKPVNAKGIFIQSTLERHETVSFAAKLYDATRLSHLISSGVSKGESTGRV